MHVETDCTSSLPVTLPLSLPFEIHPTMKGCIQLHVLDGFNGFESIADLSPAQIDTLITELTTARAYEEVN